jgi:hypothetical protein
MQSKKILTAKFAKNAAKDAKVFNHSNGGLRDAELRLTFFFAQRIQDEQFASGAFGSLIGKPVRIRHGPATVIVEGWPQCH